MLINWHKNKSIDMPQILGQHYIQYLFFSCHFNRPLYNFILVLICLSLVKMILNIFSCIYWYLVKYRFDQMPISNLPCMVRLASLTMKSGSFHSDKCPFSILELLVNMAAHDEHLEEGKMTGGDFSGSKILMCFCD